MAVIGWYNDNAHRDFPLTVGSSFLPQAALVDAGFLIGAATGFIPGEHHVRLAKVRRIANIFEFVFASDAPGLLDQELVFSRPADATEFLIGYSDGVETNPEASVSLECGSVLDWSGYLVTGDLSSLAAILTGDNQELEPGPENITANVELALIRTVSGRQVLSVNIANVERTRYAPPEGCLDLCWPFDRTPVYVRSTCITGPIRFREGYNISIQTSLFENAIQFNAGVNQGEGTPCQQVPLFAAETPPGARSMLDGSLNCNEVIRSINGAGGKFLTVAGGLGVSVVSDSARHRLLWDVNTADMAVCHAPGDDVSASIDAETSISCDCGPA